jgi:hypothetical protein
VYGSINNPSTAMRSGFLCTLSICEHTPVCGRTSRLLMNYLLACFDLPICYVYKSDRISYIQALERARETENIAVFYDFMFKQYKKFLKKEIKAMV